MSNVQLSCSALERLVARRTFPLHRRTGVCRSLFGPVDHDELGRDMRAKMREISERDAQRWNFDFEANAPLHGDYEWQEVRVDHSPAFYHHQDSARTAEDTHSWIQPATPVKQQQDSVVDEHMDVLERLSLPEGSGDSSPSSETCTSVEVNQENRADKLNSGKSTGSKQHKGPCVRRKRTASADSNSTTTTTHITDFFAKRKRAAERRSSTDSSSASCHHLSKSPITVEQTPRKRIR